MLLWTGMVDDLLTESRKSLPMVIKCYENTVCYTNIATFIMLSGSIFWKTQYILHDHYVYTEILPHTHILNRGINVPSTKGSVFQSRS